MTKLFRLGMAHLGILMLILCMSPAAAAEQSFSVSAAATVEQDNVALAVAFRIPDHYHLYADRIKVEPEGDFALEPVSIPEPKQKRDPETGTMTAAYDADTTMRYIVRGTAAPNLNIVVSYQGCSDDLCFLPVKARLSVPVGSLAEVVTNPSHTGPADAAPAGPGAESADWKTLAGRFRVVRSDVGYMKPADFLNFLDPPQNRKPKVHERVLAMFQKGGAWLWLALPLVVILGVGLNLTPCVLPMIPVNIAIIGAGAGTGSRKRGLALGAAYGAAMAATYGALGLLAVFTGTRFGTLNSLWGFNAAIAVIFAVLALAMFDVFAIDLSRFQPTGGSTPGGRRSGVFAVFAMGVISALLAGACVAPVVLTVLVLAADMCSKNNCVGLFLPFLLGLGMGLPWPFLGAGIAFLPKPGRWMVRVKYVFGTIILITAGVYGWLAFELATAKPHGKANWESSLAAGLETALKENKPALVDFGASWCKSCVAMDETTFKDDGVNARLRRFVAIEIRADDLRDPAVADTLDYFKVGGLPTYVIMEPNDQ